MGEKEREDWAAPGLSPPDGWVIRSQRGAEGTGANREPTAGLGGRVEQAELGTETAQRCSSRRQDLHGGSVESI